MTRSEKEPLSGPEIDPKREQAIAIVWSGIFTSFMNNYRGYEVKPGVQFQNIGFKYKNQPLAVMLVPLYRDEDGYPYTMTALIRTKERAHVLSSLTASGIWYYDDDEKHVIEIDTYEHVFDPDLKMHRKDEIVLLTAIRMALEELGKKEK